MGRVPGSFRVRKPVRADFATGKLIPRPPVRVKVAEMRVVSQFDERRSKGAMPVRRRPACGRHGHGATNGMPCKAKGMAPAKLRYHLNEKVTQAV